jgi:hypothetical protein
MMAFTFQQTVPRYYDHSGSFSFRKFDVLVTKNVKLDYFLSKRITAILLFITSGTRFEHKQQLPHLELPLSKSSFTLICKLTFHSRTMAVPVTRIEMPQQL